MDIIEDNDVDDVTNNNVISQPKSEKKQGFMDFLKMFFTTSYEGQQYFEGWELMICRICSEYNNCSGHLRSRCDICKFKIICGICKDINKKYLGFQMCQLCRQYNTKYNKEVLVSYRDNRKKYVDNVQQMGHNIDPLIREEIKKYRSHRCQHGILRRPFITSYWNGRFTETIHHDERRIVCNKEYREELKNQGEYVSFH